MSKYSKEFIKAISRWQMGSKNKSKKAKTLKKEIKACKLESPFNVYKGDCFRKIDLTDNSVYELGTSLKLKEQLSSWTNSIDIAKTFKKGPSRELISCIICHKPSKEEVVLNLHALYSDPNFVKAIAECSNHEIKGIMKYWNSQKEIILELDLVPITEICSLGGHIGTPEEIAEIKNEEEFKPLALTVEIVMDGLKKNGFNIGDDWWLSREGTQSVIYRTLMKGQQRGIIPSAINIDVFSSKRSNPILLSF